MKNASDSIPRKVTFKAQVSLQLERKSGKYDNVETKLKGHFKKMRIG